MLYDRVVVVPPAGCAILLHGAILCGGNPLGALYAVLIAPTVQALYVVRQIAVSLGRVARLRVVVVVIGSRPRKIPLAEVGIDKLHMIALGPVVVVGLLRKGAGLLALGTAACFVLFRGHGV